MPAVGLEYRYPFISVEPWGTQTIEPIAQLIVRPNETQIGKLPNEDAQSLIFDDSNLFSVNKFSGYDRVEGGTRLNAGIQYTAQFNRAGFFNVLFGQSYQLLGQNSFAIADTVNTGLSSGLASSRSDYVARVAYSPDSVYTFISRFLFGLYDDVSGHPGRLLTQGSVENESCSSALMSRLRSRVWLAWFCASCQFSSDFFRLNLPDDVLVSNRGGTYWTSI